MKQKRIVVVNDGIFKRQNLESYMPFCNLLKRIFEGVKMVDGDGKDTDTPAAVVTVVDSAAKAVDLAAEGSADMVIFVSEKMRTAADKLKSDISRLQVLVFTGKPDVDRPFLIPKELVTLEGFRRMVLGM